MRSKPDHLSALYGNHPQIEVCRKEREGESYLLVRSAKRVAKDKAIRERFSLRIESELTTLAASVAARKVKAQKARERIGRIRQRNQRASRYFVTELSENDGELKLTWGGVSMNRNLPMRRPSMGYTSSKPIELTWNLISCGVCT